MHLHLIVLHVKGYVGHMQEVVREIFLYYEPLVATADDEIVDTMDRINLEDMPQNGHTPDFDHGLWPADRLFTNPGPESSGENNRFQWSTPCSKITNVNRQSSTSR